MPPVFDVWTRPSKLLQHATTRCYSYSASQAGMPARQMHLTGCTHSIQAGTLLAVQLEQPFMFVCLLA